MQLFIIFCMVVNYMFLMLLFIDKSLTKQIWSVRSEPRVWHLIVFTICIPGLVLYYGSGFIFKYAPKILMAKLFKK